MILLWFLSGNFSNTIFLLSNLILMPVTEFLSPSHWGQSRKDQDGHFSQPETHRDRELQNDMCKKPACSVSPRETIDRSLYLSRYLKSFQISSHVPT